MNYGLYQAWYFTSHGLAWDAPLKKTRVTLDLLTDSNILLMFEKGIRRGVSMMSKIYTKVNKKFMKDFKPGEESSFIMYLDANNLYGWGMSQTFDFKWMVASESENWDNVVGSDSDVECSLEVDLFKDQLQDIKIS